MTTTEHRHPLRRLGSIGPSVFPLALGCTGRVVKALRGAYGASVCQTEIPINVRLAEAPSHSRTIFHYKSWSKGAHAYSRLGEEILLRARDAGLLPGSD